MACDSGTDKPIWPTQADTFRFQCQLTFMVGLMIDLLATLGYYCTCTKINGVPCIEPSFSLPVPTSATSAIPTRFKA